MSVYTGAWIVWLAAFGCIEGLALTRKNRPGQLTSLSGHVWWLVRGTAWWHHLLRLGLALFLGWLTVHLFS